MGQHQDSERGTVTAEFALGLPAVMLILLLVIGLAMHGADRVALEDGARAAARELARGESTAVAEQLALSGVRNTATVTMNTEGEYTKVTLRQPVTLLGFVQLNSELHAEANARTEHLEFLESGR